jgi:hypothetical protein
MPHFNLFGLLMKEPGQLSCQHFLASIWRLLLCNGTFHYVKVYETLQRPNYQQILCQVLPSSALHDCLRYVCFLPNHALGCILAGQVL